MARALKTFSYSDGFHVWTVAASSRIKALEAFGVKRDLFKDGSAKEIDSGPDREEALKSPGELIERGLSVDVGKVTKASATPKSKSDVGDRKRVEALERELDALDQTQTTEREELADRRTALDKEAAVLERTQTKTREALKSKLKTARAKLS
ncbi:hypothetical protein GCM10009422_22610 [Brevundimonas kwangchunensis]|uniref:Uncharacterized protein n=1 Tax=Brevundimonas kwangchunensis TaxID=322163 RepID=A0ABN1H0J8_9CAUL